MEIAARAVSPLRLAVVDDENLIRDGLVCLFRKSPGVAVVAQAGTSADAVVGLEGRFVDVALVDVCVGPSDSWDGIGAWQQAVPGVRIVVLDDVVRDVHLRRVLRHGPYGYAAERDSFAELLEIVRPAGRGEQKFSRSARERLVATPLGRQLRTTPDVSGRHLLTVRETEVLAYLAQGCTSRACSELLKISPSTVNNHKAKIMKKLNIHRMVDLAKFAIREGLVPH